MGNESTNTEQDDWLKYLGVRFVFDPLARNEPDGADSPATATAAVAAAKTAYPPKPPTQKHAVSREENDTLSKMDPATLAKQDLTQRDATGLFTEDYMKGIVGLKLQGANDP